MNQHDSHDLSSPDDFPPGDFRPEDFRSPAEGGPEISTDFVSMTLARVLADRAEIEREAAQCDAAEIEGRVLPPGLLATYAAPEPSADFVERCLAQIHLAAEVDGVGVRQLLDQYEPPRTHPEFVDRTLDALRVERSGLRLIGEAGSEAETDAAPVRSGLRPSAALMVAAALIAGLLFALWQRPEPTAVETVVAVQSAQDFSPIAWGTTLSRMQEHRAGGIRFEQVDALQLLAAGVAAAGS